MLFFYLLSVQEVCATRTSICVIGHGEDLMKSSDSRIYFAFINHQIIEWLNHRPKASPQVWTSILDWGMFCQFPIKTLLARNLLPLNSIDCNCCSGIETLASNVHFIPYRHVRLVINDRKFSVRIVFFSHTKPASSNNPRSYMKIRIVHLNLEHFSSSWWCQLRMNFEACFHWNQFKSKSFISCGWAR